MGQTKQENPIDSASRLGRFATSTQSSQGKSDPVGNLQKFAAAEQERQRKKKQEEEAAKKNPVQTAPQKGFVQSMIDKYWYGKSN